MVDSRQTPEAGVEGEQPQDDRGLTLHDSALFVEEAPAPIAGPGRGGTITLTVLAALAVGSGVGMFVGDLERESIGILAIVMMLSLIFLKVPVAAALSVPGLLGMWALRGFPVVRGTLADLPYIVIANWSLSVVPMFVLMGLLLWRSGVTGNLYVAGRQWLGWLPGGLAIGTNFAGAGLAAVSGSSIGTTYALARIGIPEMLKAGYDRRMAVGAVVVAGIGGQLIPPSILLVIYAGIAQVPVGPQLMAGVGPGVLVALAFGLTLGVMALVWPRLAGRGPAAPSFTYTPAERLKSLIDTWPVPVLVTVIIFGMFSGVLTATEAGAIAALGALLLTLYWKRKDRPFSSIGQAALSTVSTTGSIFLLLIGATILSRMLTLTGLTTGLAAWVEGLGIGRVQFLILMMVLYLIMGMFMDALSMMLLTVPILMPTLAALDIPLLWFGVFIVFMAELAIVTPPVGILAYIIHGICRDPDVNQGIEISLKDVFVAVGWFMPMAFLIGLTIIFFPDIAMYLPNMMGG